MWLIDTETLKLGQFIGRNIPSYAILSHTWAEEEVSFQDIQGQSPGRQQPTAINKIGFAKIQRTCALARQQGLQYAWIDTCCIDKSSSAELTEAINSMFKWYQRANVCYVWLSDLIPSTNIYSDDGARELGTCRWFTRGWTLQELIASRTVQFYDQDWTLVGSKSGLLRQLHAVTAIDIDVLGGDERALTYTTVAEKMSWAAGRDTTRIEDAAYCLMGIFDINMPLFYGEEEKAFQRLQNEILAKSNDVTIFAWERGEHRPPPTQSFRDTEGQRVLSGLLAESADDFGIHRHQGRIDPTSGRRPTLQVTKSSIKLFTELTWEEVPETGGRRYYIYCGSRDQGEDIIIVRLVKVVGGSFVRENMDQRAPIPNLRWDRFRRRELNLLVKFSPYPIRLFSHNVGFRTRLKFRCPENMSVAEASPWSKWNDEGCEFVAHPRAFCGSVLFHIRWLLPFSVGLQRSHSTDYVFIFDSNLPNRTGLSPFLMRGTLLERYGVFQTKVDYINSYLDSQRPGSSVFDDVVTRVGLPMADKAVINLPSPNPSALLSFSWTHKSVTSGARTEEWEVAFDINWMGDRAASSQENIIDGENTTS
ncbi:hypothetical protein CORC01_01606 [Colletotrichum orchidophilum]|uniref:Uncharacterized protein n=1 Tax=Colletotrichum orchidophilum TaxID=1209926 RepID=A0A1G4BP35_9PEZI|nr:uncharacterized protein CORC01_01606 [Colletotrichum orchidophilum]OHF03222.1 hypothetical protein CORC01_01606 [Colletotrichum orchidophilum]